MKKFLLLVILFNLTCSFKVYANTLLNLTCDQEEFHSKNSYLSKSLGHSFSDGKRFFQLEFKNNYQNLETDMLMVIDKRVAYLENNNDILEIVTPIDSMNWFHRFEINRYTGELKHTRYHAKDDKRLTVFLCKCKSQKRKF